MVSQITTTPTFWQQIIPSGNSIAGTMQQIFDNGNQEEFLAFIEKHQIDPFTIEGTNCYLIHIAAQKNWCKVIKLLIERGEVVNRRTTNKDALSALKHAIIYEKKEACSLLVELGANLSEIDEKGCTPLHWASRVGNIEITHMLLDSGANTNHIANNGMTPHHLAIHKRHLVCADRIFKKLDAEMQMRVDYVVQQQLLVNRFHAAFNILTFTSHVEIRTGHPLFSYKEIQESLAQYLCRVLKPDDFVYKSILNDVVWPLSKDPSEVATADLSNNILVLSTGWSSHEVTLVVTNTCLYLCERGVREKRGVTIYEILDQNALIKQFPCFR